MIQSTNSTQQAASSNLQARLTQLATDLLQNTIESDLRTLLELYLQKVPLLQQGDTEIIQKLRHLHSCMIYLDKVNFNANEWMLFAIPVFYCHCFKHVQNNHLFDLAVWDMEQEAVPRYLDHKCCEREARTIQEAIANYNYNL